MAVPTIDVGHEAGALSARLRFGIYASASAADADADADAKLHLVRGAQELLSLVCTHHSLRR
ncbi:MAG: hypothetical protein ABJD53_14830 [Gammaproteobacteria bacterium]